MENGETVSAVGPAAPPPVHARSGVRLVTPMSLTVFTGAGAAKREGGR